MWAIQNLRIVTNLAMISISIKFVMDSAVRTMQLEREQDDC